MPEGVIYMIEVIYKDEKQTAKGNEESFNLPKNIRQIGIPNEKYRIYIEDYVYTFLNKMEFRYRLSVYQGSSDGRGRGDFGRACRVQ